MLLATIRILTFVVVAALIRLMLYAGDPAAPWWWLLAIPFGFWFIGPTILAYACALRFRDSLWFRWLILSFLVLADGQAMSVYYHAFFVSKSSTASLAMVFVPLYQWLALGIITIPVIVAIKWAGRRGKKCQAIATRATDAEAEDGAD